jgi:hypothetical protein
MALTAVVAGNRIVISDLNQIINLLKGVTGSGENVTLIYNAEALTFQPSSDPAAGTRVWSVKNNAGTVLASMRFDGLLKLLSAAAAPATAVVGSVYWDSLLNALRVNDGTNWIDVAGGSTGPNPNLVLNSDFSRRTVFGLAMPEVFADTSGYDTGLGSGTAPTAGSNIITLNAAANVLSWPKSGTSTFWRDGRASATFKAEGTGDSYTLYFRLADMNNRVQAWIDSGANFRLSKVIAGTPTNVTSVAQTLTVNRWYWLEIEAQGTTFIVKFYDTGGTTPGVTKAASTLLQTLTGTISDAAVATGGTGLSSSRATSQWGGISTGNGGVYVETWLPESWAGDISFLGTLGGQAIGYDESDDSGPIGKQNALRVYIPAIGRQLTLFQSASSAGSPRATTPLQPSTAYTASLYVKTVSASGSGLVRYRLDSYTAALGGAVNSWTVNDASETSWTRKTATATSDSTARYLRQALQFNVGANVTGTVYVQLEQMEQGSAATAWRNAPSDDAPIVLRLATLAVPATTTSTTAVEVDSRDLAANFFLPWDATLHFDGLMGMTNTGLNIMRGQIYVDGANIDAAAADAAYSDEQVVNRIMPMPFTASGTVAAGKHRVAMRWYTSAGTLSSAGGLLPRLIVTAYRGK